MKLETIKQRKKMTKCVFNFFQTSGDRGSVHVLVRVRPLQGRIRDGFEPRRDPMLQM